MTAQMATRLTLRTFKHKKTQSLYYQAHMPRSLPLSTTAGFVTKGGFIQIQNGMHGGESEWKIISSKAGAGYFSHNELN